MALHLGSHRVLGPTPEGIISVKGRGWELWRASVQVSCPSTPPRGERRTVAHTDPETVCNVHVAQTGCQ